MPVVKLVLGDVVRTRKTHPCGGDQWEIVRLGADIGLRCLRCDRKVLMPRSKLERRIREFVRRGPGAAAPHSGSASQAGGAGGGEVGRPPPPARPPPTMALACGLVGLPNAGKSTLFRALTAAPAEIAPYPFTTITPNVGVVPIPDPRLDAVARVTRPDRIVPATIEIVDIAGLVRNAHRGEGLGNQFLGRIREVDAIVHVVRCFGGITAHVEGSVDAVRDIDIVNTELLMADLETVQRARAAIGPRARTGDHAARDEDAVLGPLEAHLAAGRPARTFPGIAAPAGMHPAAEQAIGRLHLLSSRPVLYVANLDEADLSGGPCLDAVARRAREEGAAALGLCARLEMELAELEPEQAAEFLAALGLPERGLPRLARACLELLRLRTFFSIASHEVRAWTVPAGTHAAQAAGRIHTDMERGFVRAEVVACGDLVASGSIAAARERGLVRLEGRAYEVQDGDVVTFRFAV